MNERSQAGLAGPQLRVNDRDHELTCESPRFDIVEPNGAKVLGRIGGLERDYPLVTTHPYGAGTAIYVGIPARGKLLEPVLRDLLSQLHVKLGPMVPAGVMARQVGAKQFLYLNLDGTPKRIEVKGASRSILYDREYRDGFILDPFEPDFVEVP